MEGFPRGQFAFAATLRECKSRSSARRREEAFRNGIAPAKTAVRFEPELSRANREAKRRLPSALIHETGFCLEPLPTCVRRSHRLPNCTRKPTAKPFDIPQSAERFFLTPTSITYSDCYSCANCNRSTHMRLSPFTACSPKTTRCSPCSSASTTNCDGTTSLQDQAFHCLLPAARIPDCAAGRCRWASIIPLMFPKRVEPTSPGPKHR